MTPRDVSICLKQPKLEFTLQVHTHTNWLLVEILKLFTLQYRNKSFLKEIQILQTGRWPTSVLFQPPSRVCPRFYGHKKPVRTDEADSKYLGLKPSESLEAQKLCVNRITVPSLTLKSHPENRPKPKRERIVIQPPFFKGGYIFWWQLNNARTIRIYILFTVLPSHPFIT